MSIIKKRLFALLMTMVMALSLSVSAFAAEPVDVTAEPAAAASEEVSTRASQGSQIAFGAATAKNGFAAVYVTLNSGNFFADLVGQIAYINSSDIVTCSVLTPDGDDIYLGTLSGTGARTSGCELAYARAGTYIFSFYSTTPTYEVCAYIYD